MLGNADEGMEEMPTKSGGLVRDSRGAVMAEYVVLIGTVGIGSAAAFIYVGMAFVNSFNFVRGMLLTPFP
jgi:hypothetical protein